MILKKTCWYTTIYPCRVGALIGTRDGVDLDRFLRFGFFLGAAFQIQDDLLNLTGDPERYGKERDGDLYEGKRTLMLIRLLEVSSPSEREQWSEILARSRSERTEDDVRMLRAAIDRHGCIEHARKVAHGLAGAAMHELQAAYGALPDSRHKDFIRALPVWMLERA
jgi:geranylgeranyl diphosphate synthase type II